MNGYERVGKEKIYYNVDDKNTVCANFEENDDFDNVFYDGANYYSDKKVCKNNARADKNQQLKFCPNCGRKLED